MGAAISVYTDLLASGAAFRQRFTAGDIREVSAARFCFHATSLAPALLYYLRLGADARRPKFPATISWTIRAGAPFRVHHALWACGWALMLRVLRRRGDSRLLAFAAQMVATGAMTTGVCALGQVQSLSETRREHQQRSAKHCSKSFIST